MEMFSIFECYVPVTTGKLNLVLSLCHKNLVCNPICILKYGIACVVKGLYEVVYVVKLGLNWGLRSTILKH